jgi:hypothetical protein
VNAGDDVNGQISSESLGDYSASYIASASVLPKQAMKLLHPYVPYSRFV